MSELGDHEAIEPPAADAMVARLDEILDDFASAVADNSTVSDAVRIDRIARLEKLRAATAALQVAESVRFAQIPSCRADDADGIQGRRRLYPQGRL
jgi:hypothetical protein